MGSVEPMIINDVETEPEFHEIPAVAVFGMRSYIGVPIVLSSGRVYGTLCALDRAPQSKTDDDLSTLVILARLLASQIDREEFGAIEERQRLAREIHDTLAQTLSALALDLSLHAIRLRTVAPALEPEARRLHDEARAALRETRRSVWNLQPGALDGRTLAEAIGEELRRLTRAGVDASIELRGSPAPLAPATEATLLRVAQEALANVRKHSGAGQAVVTLDYADDIVTLQVDDDGRGIDLARLGPATEQGGFGLSSVRERARLAGGDAQVFSRPGGGTSVICSVPRAAAAEPAPLPAPAVPLAGDIVRVALVDDHPVVRHGLRGILEAGGVQVVCEAADGASALAVIAEARPDVVLLDIQMPGGGGLACLERLAALEPPPPVVILTTFAQDEVVYRALRLGARGYLLKDAGPDELARAVHVVARGGSLLAPLAVERLGGRAGQAETLTPREREVLALVADGLRNKEIALQLGTSEKTVQFHIANVFGKLGVTSRAEATRVAIERGFVLATAG